MDNLGNSGTHPSNNADPVPLDPGPSGPASSEPKPANGTAAISRAPLSLGGANAAPAAPATPTAPAAPAARPAPAGVPKAAAPGPRPVPVRPPAPASNDRVTGCKTFYTKLHPGAIDFLDEQINQWLKDNPGVVIKMTNTTTGEVQGKKTEANILMTVWYHGHAAKTISHMG